jgi:hypothetical protein
MSDEASDRIAVIQHERRQHEALRALSAISDKLGDARHAPVDPGVSLRTQCELYATLKAMRASAELHSAKFATAEAAVDEFFTRASRLPPDAICEFYMGARGSGFFIGTLSRAFVKSCLAQGHEGIAIVQPTLASGVLLDVARDDPLLGDFYEVEWW